MNIIPHTYSHVQLPLKYYFIHYLDTIKSPIHKTIKKYYHNLNLDKHQLVKLLGFNYQPLAIKGNLKLEFWKVREELSLSNKLRRSYYELLRDELDQFILQYGLIDSYNNFIKKKIAYPFVEKRELKPRALIPNFEYESQNTFLIIFIEDTITDSHKKYIRFFSTNKASKTNLLQLKILKPIPDFDRNQKYLESSNFIEFISSLLPIDYALLIQKDSSNNIRNRYCLSHFHVRIDWPIADAAEDMALRLRYISKDLYEKGDTYAEDIQKKYFEYFGLPVMVGGRRTAAAVAAQYLKRIPCITTVYVGSSESRALIRICEKGVSKTVLIKITDDEIEPLIKDGLIDLQNFDIKYVVTYEGDKKICLFRTIYAYTEHARPPVDGKLRELKPDLNWLTVHSQHILPKPDIINHPPLPFNLIYSQL